MHMRFEKTLNGYLCIFIMYSVHKLNAMYDILFSSSSSIYIASSRQ